MWDGLGIVLQLLLIATGHSDWVSCWDLFVWAGSTKWVLILNLRFEWDLLFVGSLLVPYVMTFVSNWICRTSGWQWNEVWSLGLWHWIFFNFWWLGYLLTLWSCYVRVWCSWRDRRSMFALLQWSNKRGCVWYHELG